MDGQVRNIVDEGDEKHQTQEHRNPPATTLPQWAGEGHQVDVNHPFHEHQTPSVTTMQQQEVEGGRDVIQAIDGKETYVNQVEDENHHIHEQQNAPATTLSEPIGEGGVSIRTMVEQMMKDHELDENQHTHEYQSSPVTATSERIGDDQVVIPQTDDLETNAHALGEKHHTHEYQSPPTTMMSQLSGEFQVVIHTSEGQVSNVHHVDEESHIQEHPSPQAVVMSEQIGEDKVVIHTTEGQVSSVHQVDDEPQPNEHQSPQAAVMSEQIGEDKVVIHTTEGQVSNVHQVDDEPQPHEHQSSIATAMSEWVEDDHGLIQMDENNHIPECQNPPVVTMSLLSGEFQGVIHTTEGQVSNVHQLDEEHHIQEYQSSPATAMLDRIEQIMQNHAFNESRHIHENQNPPVTTMSLLSGEIRGVILDEEPQIHQDPSPPATAMSERGGEGQVLIQPMDGQLMKHHELDENHPSHQDQSPSATTMSQLSGEGPVGMHATDGQLGNVHQVDDNYHFQEQQEPLTTTMIGAGHGIIQRNISRNRVTGPSDDEDDWEEDDDWEEGPPSKYSHLSRTGRGHPRSEGSDREVHASGETDSQASFHRPPTNSPQPRGLISSLKSAAWVEPPFMRSTSKSYHCIKIMVSILYIAGVIGCGFFLAIATGARKVNTEEKAAALLNTNVNVCLKGRIQQRSKVRLFLALEGLTIESVDGLDGIIENAVRDGYNTASGGCSDSCNRWAYLSKVESEEDFELDNGNPAVFTQVITYLSQQNCRPGESFASVYPGELDRMRRTLTLQNDENIPNQYLPSPAQAHEPWPTIGNGHFEPTAGNGREKSGTSSSTFFANEPRMLQENELDFQTVMTAIEDHIMRALDSYHNHAGFIGIQQVLIVQPNSDQMLSQIAYLRAAPGMEYARAGKSEKAFGVDGPGPYPVGLKEGRKTTKAPTGKVTKAPSTKTTKAPGGKSTKSPSGGKSTKSPSGGKSTKSPSGGKSTKSPSGKSTKAPSGGKTTKSPKSYCSTKAPKSTKSPSTKSPKTNARHGRLGGPAVGGLRRPFGGF